MPWIIRNGGQAYLECGKPNNGGTKIFSVSGDVEKPGNYEIPLGTPFSKLLELAGGVRALNRTGAHHHARDPVLGEHAGVRRESDAPRIVRELTRT